MIVDPKRKKRKKPAMACPLCVYAAEDYFHLHRARRVGSHLFYDHLLINERRGGLCPCCQRWFFSAEFGYHFRQHWKEIFLAIHAQLLGINPEKP